MKNNILGEVIISVALLSLLVFFLNPLSLIMPRVMHTLMIPGVVVLGILFVAFLWKESPGDEREQFHTYLSSRFAYMSGIVCLLLAITIQHFTATIDPWLIITICIMLLAKIIGRIYGHVAK